MTISSSELTADGVTRRGGRMGVGAWLRTTPGRMRLFSVVSIGMIAVLLVVGATSIAARRSAANSVANDSGPRLVDTEDLYRALADIDATASGAVLGAGNWPTDVRNRYLDDLDRAGTLLTNVTKNAEGADAEHAATIAKQLPSYTASVEAARTNIRFGYPIGAEHMRQASERMQEEILPAALALYRSASADLHDDYGAGTSASQITWIAVIGVGALIVLAMAQLYVTRRTNRVINPPLLAASVIVLIVAAWAIGQFVMQQNNLVDAQRKGSDSVEVLSSARILGLQAQAVASLALAERGTGDEYLALFDEYVKKLGGSNCRGGEIGNAAEYASRTGDESHVNEISQMCVGYLAAHTATRELDDAGTYLPAVQSALGPEAEAGGTMDRAIGAEIARSQARFDASASDARSGFGILAIALVIGLIAGGVLVFFGLQRRIGEYR